MAEPRRDTLGTYRHLRVAMVVLLLLLLVSVAVEAVRTGGFEGSISAYFFTPVRSVFVGTLCAVGASLIVYRGRTDPEDIVLNVSGFLAFVVAFVPTKAPDGTPDAPIADAITNNLWTLLVTAAVAVAVAWRLVRRTDGTRDVAVEASLAGAGGLLVVLGTYFAAARTHFLSWAHLGAAGAMFAGMTLVVGLNAREARAAEGDDPQVCARRIWYPRLFVAMVGTAVVVGGAAIAGLPKGALTLEALLLAEFGAFWFLQTHALWGEATDPAPPTAASPAT